jgi:hypothetical protein
MGDFAMLTQGFFLNASPVPHRPHHSSWCRILELGVDTLGTLSCQALKGHSTVPFAEVAFPFIDMPPSATRQI